VYDWSIFGLCQYVVAYRGPTLFSSCNEILIGLGTMSIGGLSLPLQWLQTRYNLHSNSISTRCALIRYNSHLKQQEIWAHAHETRESLQQFLFADNLGLSPSILAQFTFLAAKNRQKSTKTRYFKVHSHLRSSMLIFPRSSSPVLVMISSMSVPISNYFHARQANNGWITTFWHPLAQASLNLEEGTYTAKICIQCWKFLSQVV